MTQPTGRRHAGRLGRRYRVSAGTVHHMTNPLHRMRYRMMTTTSWTRLLSRHNTRQRHDQYQQTNYSSYHHESSYLVLET